MPETTNGLPYPPGTGVLPDVPYWMQQLAEALDGTVADTGWQDIDLLNGWSASGALTPQYRVKDGITYLRGRVTGGTAVTVTQLPEGARPSATATPVTRDGGTPNVTVLTLLDDGRIQAVVGTSPNLDVRPFPADG